MANFRQNDRVGRVNKRFIEQFFANVVLVIFAIILVSFGSEALASGPSSNRILNYQIRLTDASNILVPNGTKNLKLTLYDASSAGTQLYTACSSDGTPTGVPAAVVTTFTGGTATVLIGDTGVTCATGTAVAIPSTLFNSVAIWLGVTVEADAEMTPRKHVVAAGYALNSERLNDLLTSNAGGSNAYVPVTDASGNLTLTKNVTVDTNSFFVDATSHRVGIGTAAPGALLSVGTGSALTVDASGNVVTSGTIAGNGGTLSTTAATFGLVNTGATTVNFAGAATTLSIGAATGTITIANPTVTLSNATALNMNGVSPSIATSSTGTASVFNANALTGNLFGAATTVNVGGAAPAETVNIAGGSASTGCTVDASGNLGCSGTGSFSGASSAGNLNPSADNTYDLGTAALRWRKLEVGPGSVELTSTTGTAGAGANYTLGSLAFSTTNLKLATSAVGSGSAGTLQLTTGANVGLNVDGSGNVGIGTSTPTAMLQVTEPTVSTGTVATNGTTTLTGTGTQFTNTFRVGDTITVTGETVRTIATVVSDTSLTVTVAFSTTASGLAYTLVGGDRFVVRGNGSVSIGTATPVIYIGHPMALTVSNPNDAYAVLALKSATPLIKWVGTYNAGDGAELYQDTAGTFTLNPNSGVSGFKIYAAGAAQFTPGTAFASFGPVNPSTSALGKVHITGTGATNATNALYVENSASTNLLTVRNDGNVGIGTASPGYALDVAGTIGVGHDSAGYDSTIYHSSSSPYRALTLKSLGGAGGWAGRINFDTNYNGGSSFTGMTVAANGDGITANVGIGTSTPAQKLDVFDGHIRMDQVVAPAAPTVAVGAAGVLTGAYYYSVSFVTALGETESGAISAVVNPAAQQVSLSAIPVSADSAVTSRRIYRTTAGGATNFTYYVATIADNVTTTYTDNLADVSLGVSEPQVNTTGGILFNGTVRAMVADNATTSLGLNALRVNTGLSNSAVGFNALRSNTTGYDNSAFGHSALYSNTTGYYNTASGLYALYNNTTGYYNNAMGVNALYNNTTGYANNAMGNEALRLNTSGTYNTATGLQALYSNSTGIDNSAVGANSLYANTTGHDNTAVGFTSLRFNTTGYDNTATGVNALYSNTTGYYSTAMGMNALNSNINGSYNTAMGMNALTSNTTGIFNTAMGFGALQNNTTAGSNTATGVDALYSNTTGTNNTALGMQAGYTATPANANVTGSDDTFIGFNSGPGVATQLSNAIAIGSGALVSTSNTAVLGNDSIATTVLKGNVGIGTSAPAQKLDVFDGHIRMDQVAAPAAPTATVGAAGVLTGAYRYAVSFVTALGETEDGAYSAIVNPAAQQVSLSAIPVSADAAVTSRKIYRTTSGGVWFQMQYVATIADNVTTTYTDNLADGSLGVGEPQVNTTGGILYNGAVRAMVADNATTSLGLGALRVSTGHFNTAVGLNALYNNTTGYYNTAVGNVSLYSNTTGYNNVASGAYALYGNTTGHDNNAMGQQALYVNTTGFYNNAMGAYALTANTTGYDNNAMGAYALGNNTTGYFNTAVGLDSLYSNTSGYNNTAIGMQAGYTATPANANVTGSDDVFIGYNSGPGVATQLSNAIAIGSGALVSASNRAVLGNDSILTTMLKGSVGIGTSDALPPIERLTVVGGARIGTAPAALTTVTDNPLLIGAVTVNVVSTTSYPSAGTLLIESEAMTYTGTTATSFTGVVRGVYGTTAASHVSATPVNVYLQADIAQTGAAPKLAVMGNGYVGIGTANPSYKVEINQGNVTNLYGLAITNDGAGNGGIAIRPQGGGTYDLGDTSGTSFVNSITNRSIVYSVGNNGYDTPTEYGMLFEVDTPAQRTSFMFQNGTVGGIQSADTMTFEDSNWNDMSSITGSGAYNTPSLGLGRGENLLTYSEQLDNAAWTKTAVATGANAVTAPDGTSTAESITNNGVATSHQVTQTITATAATNYVFTVWLKNSSVPASSTIALKLTDNGTVPQTVSHNIYKQNNALTSTGWRRFSIPITTSSGTTTLKAIIDTGAAANAWVLYAWGAQLEKQSTSGAYVQTTASAVSTTRQGLLIGNQGNIWDGGDFSFLAGGAGVSSRNIHNLTQDPGSPGDGLVITAGAAGTATAAGLNGGTLTLAGGAATVASSGAGGVGGGVTLTTASGTASVTSGAGGAGGAFSFTAGNGAATPIASTASGVGGSFTFTPGTGAANSTGSGGSAGNAGGVIFAAAAGGASSTNGTTRGVGSAFTVNLGVGGILSGGSFAAAGTGGAFTVNGGAGGDATGSSTGMRGGVGSAITLTAGIGGNVTAASDSSSHGGTGGYITMTTGAGGIVSTAGSTGSGATSGQLTLATGTGGAGSVSGGDGGVSGDINFTVGNGGAPTSSSANGGAAGTMWLNGGSGGVSGAAGTSGGAGGTISIRAGDGGGSSGGFTGGVGGNVILQAGSGGIGGASANGGNVTLNSGGIGASGTIGKIDFQISSVSKLQLNASGNLIFQATGQTVDYSSAATGNTFIWKVPERSVGAGNCATGVAEGIIFQRNNGTQLGHMCIDPSGTALKFYANQFNAASTDLAERYSTNIDEHLEAGDVVELDPAGNLAVRKTTTKDSAAVFGVISDAPGLVLSGIDEATKHSDTINGMNVALKGRVPVKVSMENGPIAVGDYLASSSTPGIAMKAIDAGTVIGRALDAATADGTVRVFMEVGYWNGDGTVGGSSVLAPNLPSLTNTSNMDMAGYGITTIGKLAGINSIWSIDSDGNIATRGTVVTNVQTDNGDVPVYATGSQKAEITLSGSAQLTNGTAVVVFDDVSQHIIGGGTPIKVVVTLTAESAGVYVTDKTIHGFTVHELNGGSSSATFDWMAIARRKGFDDVGPVAPAPAPAPSPAPAPAPTPAPDPAPAPAPAPAPDPAPAPAPAPAPTPAPDPAPAPAPAPAPTP